MAATTIKKARPKFKLEQFRDLAIEAKGQEVGVDIELDAGTYEVHDVDDDGNDIIVETIEVAEGDVVHVPHPLMLDDDHQDAFDRYQRLEDLDQVEYTDEETGEKRTRAKVPFTVDGKPAPGGTYRMAASIIGEHELRRLLAGGGHSNDVALAWEYLTRDHRLDKDPKAQRQRR